MGSWRTESSPDLLGGNMSSHQGVLSLSHHHTFIHQYSGVKNPCSIPRYIYVIYALHGPRVTDNFHCSAVTSEVLKESRHCVHIFVKSVIHHRRPSYYCSSVAGTSFLQSFCPVQFSLTVEMLASLMRLDYLNP